MGPKAKARTKMDRKICASSSAVPRSSEMAWSDVASMAPDMSVTSPPLERRMVMAHLRRRGQLNGCCGSASPCHVTWTS